jgi:3-deoxy-D-manno-octulosonic-acid transferase/heptosyltransferase-1
MNNRVNHILIIKMSAIGDVVHSLPFLEVLMENFPKASIDWVVEQDASQVIMGHPGLNRVIVSLRKEWQRRILKGNARLPVMGEIAGLMRQLRKQEYDLVIDLQGLFRSGIIAWLTRGKRKIGMAGSREGAWLFWNERPVRVDYKQHAIDRYLQLADYLDCRINCWKGEIPVFESDRTGIENLLDAEGLKGMPLVAVNPMAGWKTKLWLPERFAILADRVSAELSCEIVFTGSGQDRPEIEEIATLMNERPANLAGRTTLKELAYLYSNCKALVTTDTGPMHIAAAMGCSVVALFGPTAPLTTGPYGSGHRVIRAHQECSPCFKKTCDHITCMRDISIESVFEAVKERVTKITTRDHLNP